MTVMELIRRETRGFSFLQGLVILIVGASAMQMTLWVTDRTPPFTLKRSWAVNTAVPGGTVVIRYEIERHRSCPYRTDRYIITSENIRIPLSDSEDGGAPGALGLVEYGVDVDVPARVPPGPTTYLAILSYRCNPLQYYYPSVIRVPTRFVVAAR